MRVCPSIFTYASQSAMPFSKNSKYRMTMIQTFDNPSLPIPSLTLTLTLSEILYALPIVFSASLIFRN
jgi:hypothetical protein